MRLLICLSLCAALAACSDDVPCKEMTSSGGVAEAAAAFTLAAYPANASCDALGGAPIATSTAAKGEALKLSIKPGTYLFVVTAYADAAATMAIGRSCTTQKAGSGAKVCFNLVIAALDLMSSDLLAADLASPDLHATEEGDMTPADLETTPDLTEVDLTELDLFEPDLYLPPPPDLLTSDLTKVTCSTEGAVCPNGAGTCCGGVCIDVDFDPDNCGGCGRVCSSTDTTERSCSLGLCNSTCVSKRGNCSLPAAPATDNGCETNLTASISQCGACGAACNTTTANNTARTCMDPGVCSYTCAANRKDCKVEGSNLDGCECEGTACCGASCQTKHATGDGQSWYDCDAIATYNVEQATEACVAWGGGASCAASTCATGARKTVCGSKTLACACWVYEATDGTTGHMATALEAVGICLAPCPSTSNNVWQ